MPAFIISPSIIGFRPLLFRKLLYAISIFSLFSVSCERRIETIPKSDIELLPSLIEKDFETVYTDSARLQLVMRSPLMERYTDRKPQYTEFRKGITVFFHDGNPDPIASISCRYARYIEDKNLWELKDSVTAVNEKNETLETELLYWDQDKDVVYTDRFVRIKSEEQIVMGTGFEANSRLTRWKIRNVSATIYLNDEE